MGRALPPRQVRYTAEESNTFARIVNELQPGNSMKDYHQLAQEYNARKPIGSPTRTVHALLSRLRELRNGLHDYGSNTSLDAPAAVQTSLETSLINPHQVTLPEAVLHASSTECDFEVVMDSEGGCSPRAPTPHVSKSSTLDTDSHIETTDPKPSIRRTGKLYSPEESRLFLSLLEEWKPVNTLNAKRFTDAYNGKRPKGSPERTTKALLCKIGRLSNLKSQPGKKCTPAVRISRSSVNSRATRGKSATTEDVLMEDSSLPTTHVSMFANSTQAAATVFVKPLPETTAPSQLSTQHLQSAKSTGAGLQASHQTSAHVHRILPASDSAASSIAWTTSNSDANPILQSLSIIEHRFSALEERLSNLEQRTATGEKQNGMDVDTVQAKIAKVINNLEKAGKSALEQMELLKAMHKSRNVVHSLG
ncbi:hypothetical protein HDV05_000442 [Chytridiales sp. JEL 0842]|nr:hypothetical protein HDV05_000442 [Chytridiales sp. JEL 0842]